MFTPSQSVAVLALAACSSGQPAQTAEPSTSQGSSTVVASDSESATYLVSFIVMREGAQPERREDYAARLDAIAERHGIVHSHAYRVARPVSGALTDASEVHLWRIPSEDALARLFADDAYLALADQRAELHNEARITTYVADANMDGPQLDTPFVLVDLVFLNDGKTLDDRAAYGQQMGPIAARYNVGPTRSYGNLRHRSGPGEGAVQLNLWPIHDPAVVGQVVQDPDYQALVPLRDEIHDMARLTMLVAQPIEGERRSSTRTPHPTVSRSRSHSRSSSSPTRCSGSTSAEISSPRSSPPSTRTTRFPFSSTRIRSSPSPVRSSGTSQKRPGAFCRPRWRRARAFTKHSCFRWRPSGRCSASSWSSAAWKNEFPTVTRRYFLEVERIFGVMNKRLANADYLGGEDYSIADIASLPWVRMAVIHPATAELDLAQHPQLHDWWKRVSARPAVTRGLAVPEPFPPEEQFKAFVSATVGLE